MAARSTRRSVWIAVLTSTIVAGTVAVVAVRRRLAQRRQAKSQAQLQVQAQAQVSSSNRQAVGKLWVREGKLFVAKETTESYEKCLLPAFHDTPISRLLLGDFSGNSDLGVYCLKYPRMWRVMSAGEHVFFLFPNPAHSRMLFDESVDLDTRLQTAKERGFRFVAFWLHRQMVDAMKFWDAAGNPTGAAPKERMRQLLRDPSLTPVWSMNIHDPNNTDSSNTFKPADDFLHCCRDLRREHAAQLRELKAQAEAYLTDLFHLTAEEASQVQSFMHYPNKPHWSILHVHFAFKHPESQLAATRSHPLSDIIDTLEASGRYDPTAVRPDGYILDDSDLEALHSIMEFASIVPVME